MLVKKGKLSEGETKKRVVGGKVGEGEGKSDKGNNAWHKLYNLCLIIYNNGTNINNLSLNGFCPENYIILHQ